MINKKNSIICSLILSAFSVALYSSEGQEGSAQEVPVQQEAGQDSYRKAKTHYFEKKNEREDVASSDWAHVKKTGISVGIQLLGTKADRALSFGMDSLRSRWGWLTEDEEDQKQLTKETIATKIKEKELLASRTDSQKIDDLLKLCDTRHVTKEECGERLRKYLEKLEAK
jgi:hypothetical protein